MNHVRATKISEATQLSSNILTSAVPGQLSKRTTRVDTNHVIFIFSCLLQFGQRNMFKGNDRASLGSVFVSKFCLRNRAIFFFVWIKITRIWKPNNYLAFIWVYTQNNPLNNNYKAHPTIKNADPVWREFKYQLYQRNSEPARKVGEGPLSLSACWQLLVWYNRQFSRVLQLHILLILPWCDCRPWWTAPWPQYDNWRPPKLQRSQTSIF